jgi:simple sugar transport system permease protein
VARVFQGMLLFFVLGCDTLIHYRIRVIGLALTKPQGAAKLEAAPKLKEAR